MTLSTCCPSIVVVGPFVSAPWSASAVSRSWFRSVSEPSVEKLPLDAGAFSHLPSQQLRRRGTAEVAVEGRAAADVGGAVDLDQVEGEPALGDLPATALARDEFQVERDRGAGADDRAGDVHGAGAVGRGRGGRDDLRRRLGGDAVAR